MVSTNQPSPRNLICILCTYYSVYIYHTFAIKLSNCLKKNLQLWGLNLQYDPPLPLVRAFRSSSLDLVVKLLHVAYGATT